MSLIIILILIGAILLSTIFSLFQLHRTTRLKKIHSSELEEWNNIKHYYEELKPHIQTSLKQNHDINKHMTIIMDLLNNVPNDTEANDQTGNPILSSLLTLKRDECLKNEIPFIVMLDQTDVSDYSNLSKQVNIAPLRAFDMVTLLANLLDNAIEASLKVPKSACGITIHFISDSSLHFILLNKTILTTLDENTFTTTKEDSESHGFGTQLIASIAEKYNGKQKITLDNGWLIQEFHW